MLKAVLVLVLVYGAAALTAHLVADSMIFPAPAPSYGQDPGLIFLRMPDGTPIAACWLPAAGPLGPQSPVILYSHGNAEDLGTALPSLLDLNRRGYSVLAYDYPGYGRSGGKPSEAGTNAAIRVAWDWLTGQGGAGAEAADGPGPSPGIEARQVIIYGYSLGGGPSIDLASQVKPGGLVLEAAFSTAYRVMTGIDLFPGDRFRNIDKIDRVQAPVFILQGGQDRVIPPSHGHDLLARAREPKRGFFLPQAGHEDLRFVAGEGYWRELAEFVRLCGLEAQ